MCWRGRLRGRWGGEGDHMSACHRAAIAYFISSSHSLSDPLVMLGKRVSVKVS